MASAARPLYDEGGYTLAYTALPGGGSARMWSPGPRSPLWLELDRPGRPALRTPSGALPDDADIQDIWYGGHSLTADATGIYGSTAYTRDDRLPYYYPIFRYRFDGMLDRSFGGDGVVLVRPPGIRHFATTQTLADGRGGVLVVGGTDIGARRITFVLRVLGDGALDTSFGDAGVVRLPLPRPSEDNFMSSNAGVDVRPDGRIAVAAGVPSGASSVWLLGADGTVDRAAATAGSCSRLARGRGTRIAGSGRPAVARTHRRRGGRRGRRESSR